ARRGTRRHGGARESGSASRRADRIRPARGNNARDFWSERPNPLGDSSQGPNPQSISRGSARRRDSGRAARRIDGIMIDPGSRIPDPAEERRFRIVKVVLFGATGMIGQGVLRECLLAGDVEAVLAIGRSVTDVQHPKLREIVHADLWHYASIEEQLRGFDACFFCLGVTSAGMTEADYSRVTYGITMAAAETRGLLNPN